MFLFFLPFFSRASSPQVFDSDPGGTHDYIGACQASLRQLKAAAASGQGLPLLNSKKASKPGYVSSGTLVVKAANVTPRPSFLDYIRGGCTLNFLVAIDFTASNGDPRNPSSLHHYSDRPTIYEGACAARLGCHSVLSYASALGPAVEVV
jgi:hypothetical protein